MVALWIVVTPGMAAASARKPGSKGGARARWVLQTFSTRPAHRRGGGGRELSSGRLLFRGVGRVPAAVSALGFNHVGDEDIDRFGDVYDAYENDHLDPVSKLFTITAPTGK